MGKYLEEGCLLRIFVGEADRHDGIALYEWVVQMARDHGIAGATALRGMAGYGVHHRIHSGKILRLTTDLPVIVEIVDTVENIKRFLPVLDDVIHEGIATLERVEIRSFGEAPPHTPESES